MGRRAKLVLVGLLLAPTLALQSGGVEAAPAGQVPKPLQLAAIDPVALTGQALDVAATKITAQAQTHTTIGLVGTAVDIPSKTLTIYWNGSVPADVSALISKQQGLITIQVKNAPYSAATLSAEANRLMTLFGPSSATPIIEVGALLDYSGLLVTFDKQRVTAITPGVIAAVTSPLPLQFGLGGPFIAFTCPPQCPGFRWNDNPAYFGGDAIFSASTGQHCSTSFAVTAATSDAVLTAGHCGLNGSYTIEGNGKAVGTSWSCCSGTPDITPISGQTYAPYVYVGSYTSTTANPVVASTTNAYGAIRCFGGAWSGEVCNNKVTSTALETIRVRNIDGTYTAVGPGVWMQQQSSLAAAGQGDSGGPVYTVNPITFDITAAGVISVGDSNYPNPCQGIMGTGRICAFRNFVSDLTSGLSYLPYSLKTTPLTTKAMKNASGGRCADNYSQQGGANGSELQLYDCNSGNTQEWTFPGDGTIRSSMQGRCLTLPPASFDAPYQWSSAPFYGTVTTLAGDVNLDGKADLIAVNGGSTYVMTSSGAGFNPPALWSGAPFNGTRAVLSADIDGDGRADLIAVNWDPSSATGSTWVMTSTGNGFNPPTQWSSQPFSGSLAIFATDVNGDGKADLVAVNGSSVYVMTSAGTSFNAPQLWSSQAFSGTRALVAGDVNLDGKADLVAVNYDPTTNSGSSWVMTSTGSAFAAPQQWSSWPFNGNAAVLMSDVNGDRAADLVAVNYSSTSGTGSTWIMTSTGSGFAAPAQWSGVPFAGTYATVAGDSSGDGRGDLNAVNATSAFVMTSNGSGGNGTRLQLWDCNGGTSQLWNVGTDGRIRSAVNSRCLDADANGAGTNGTKVQIWDCGTGLNQVWSFV